MEDIIHLLPDSVANQIAAGEVVQRPANVIKEMVENAIDAGARNIQVLVVDGGMTEIQIVDDGKGMSETDARLSFERHATSKIRKAADLYQLTTMGFRGEALASIAAVAQVDLKTRRAEDELGTFIQISGSRVERQEPVACSVGCNFSVKNLFYNVPARRRFVKSTRTEFQEIVKVLNKIVLVYPEISFTLYNNGAECMRLGEGGLRKRIIDVFGKKLNGEIIPIECETNLVSISGFVSKPEASKKKGTDEYLFVNGRYMKDAYFHSAVMHAYENLIPAGDRVSYFVYFSVDPATIDVNVSPTKEEIKFQNSQDIWQVVSATVREAIGKHSNVSLIDFDVEGRPDIPAMGQYINVTEPPRNITPSYNPFDEISAENVGFIEADETEGKTDHAPAGSFEHSFSRAKGTNIKFSNGGKNYVPANWTDLYEGSRLNVPQTESLPSGQELFDDSMFEASRMNSLYDPHSRKLHYQGRYIVQVVESGLMFVDQKRAHIRVLYEEFLQNLNAHKRPSQKNMFGTIVQFTPEEVSALEEAMSDVEALGFELNNLGGGSFNIVGEPSGLDGINPELLLHDVVSAVVEHRGSSREALHQSVALAMARKSCIETGQTISETEMENLLKKLFETTSPARTPDGKIVYAVVEHKVVDRYF